MKFHLGVVEPYDFARSVRDHGWISLAPCRWLEGTQTFETVERLSGGQVVLLHIRKVAVRNGPSLEVTVEDGSTLRGSEQAEIASMIRWMLRLDEDLTLFYELAAQDGDLWEAVKTGRGRLLRSSTLFEDVVKTICTTNTTWRQTAAMVGRLVECLGDPYPPDPQLHAFPTPEQLANASPELLKQEVRLGYRSDYIQQLAREVVTGKRELEALKDSDLTAGELRKALLDIKGVGDYAANTLLMLLGHYGHLAVDSEMRALTGKKYFNGESPSETDMRALYESWGDWKYLAYWFELLD